MRDRNILIGLACGAVGLITAAVVSVTVFPGANPNDDWAESNSASPAAADSQVEALPEQPSPSPTPSPSPSATMASDGSLEYEEGEAKFNDAYAPYTIDDAWWVFVIWCTFDRTMYSEPKWLGPDSEEQVEFLQVVAALLGYDPGPIEGEWNRGLLHG